MTHNKGQRKTVEATPKQIKLEIAFSGKSGKSRLKSQFFTKKNIQMLKRSQIFNNSNVKSTLEMVNNHLSLIKVNTMKIYKNIGKNKNKLYIYVKEGVVVNEVVESNRTLKDEIGERASNWVRQRRVVLRLFQDRYIRINKSLVLAHLVDNNSLTSDIGRFIEYRQRDRWISGQPVFNFWINRKIRFVQRFVRNVLRKVRIRDTESKERAALAITQFIRRISAVNRLRRQIRSKNDKNHRQYEKSIKQHRADLFNDDIQVKLILEESIRFKGKDVYVFNFYHLFELLNKNVTLLFFCSYSIKKKIMDYFKTMLKVFNFVKLERRLIFVNITPKLMGLSDTIDPALKLITCTKSLEFLGCALKSQNAVLYGESPISDHITNLTNRLKVKLPSETVFNRRINKQLESYLSTGNITLAVVKNAVSKNKKQRSSLKLNKLNQVAVTKFIKRSGTYNTLEKPSNLYKSVEVNNKGIPAKLAIALPKINLKKQCNKLNKNWSQKLFDAQNDNVQEKTNKNKALQNIFKTEIPFANSKAKKDFVFTVNPVSFRRKPLQSFSDIKKHLACFMKTTVFESINKFELVFKQRQLCVSLQIKRNSPEIQNEREFSVRVDKHFIILVQTTNTIKNVYELNKLLSTDTGYLSIKKYGYFKFNDLVFNLQIGLNIEVSDPLIVIRNHCVETYCSLSKLTAEQLKVKWQIHRAIQLSSPYNGKRVTGTFPLNFIEVKKDTETVKILLENKQDKTHAPFLLKRDNFLKLFVSNSKYLLVRQIKLSFIKKIKFNEFLEVLKIEGFVYNFNTKEGLLVLPYQLMSNIVLFDILIVNRETKNVVDLLEKFTNYVKTQKNRLDIQNIESLQEIIRRNREEF